MGFVGLKGRFDMVDGFAACNEQSRRIVHYNCRELMLNLCKDQRVPRKYCLPYSDWTPLDGFVE